MASRSQQAKLGLKSTSSAGRERELRSSRSIRWCGEAMEREDALESGEGRALLPLVISLLDLLGFVVLFCFVSLGSFLRIQARKKRIHLPLALEAFRVFFFCFSLQQLCPGLCAQMHLELNVHN